MISGKKPFVPGKSFKFPSFIRLSDNRKGRPCPNCGIYRKNENFTKVGEDCRICKLKQL